MEMLTEVDGMLISCFVDTATTVRVFNNARGEYRSCGTADGEETKHLLVHYTPYHMGFLSWQAPGPFFCLENAAI